jgi:hypothetical protein
MLMRTAAGMMTGTAGMVTGMAFATGVATGFALGAGVIGGAMLAKRMWDERQGWRDGGMGAMPDPMPPSSDSVSADPLPDAPSA